MRTVLAWLIFLGELTAWSASALRPPPGSQFNVTRGTPIPTTKTFQSPNRRYRLVVEETDLTVRASGSVKLTGTMVKIQGGTTTTLWRANFKGNNIPFLRDSEVLVADDGSFFAVSPMERDWYLFKQDHDQIVVPTYAQRAQNVISSLDEGIMEMDRIENENILRFWSKDADQWVAYSVDREKSVKPTPELLVKWNETTRRHILERMARAKNDAMRKKIDSISPSLARVADAAIPATDPNELRQVNYEFLALRRNPADRIWFEQALTRRFDPTRTQFAMGPGTYFISNGKIVTVFMNAGGTFRNWSQRDDRLLNEDYEREVADWFLALFDKKIDRNKTRLSPGGSGPLYNLGKVNGAILLPAPILGKQGTMRAYLVPDERAGKTWDPAEIELITAPLRQVSEDQKDFPDEITFAFATVLPGKYKLKAVWDKRPHFTDEHAAGPGDYESDWLGPITVKAGDVLNNLHVFCTNRAGAIGGEMYYKADEIARAQKWEPKRDLSFSSFPPDPHGRAEISASKFSDWVVRTNSHAAARDTLERISFVTADKLTNPRSLPRPPKLAVMWWSGHFVNGQSAAPPASLRIIDEHGCAFAPDDTRSSRNASMALFGAFPRSAATFRLVGYGPNGKSEPLFDYTLKNRARAERQVLPKPTQLPITLTLGSVQLNIKKVTAPNLNGWMDALFTETGKETTAWWASEIIFADSDGNILDPAAMCREEQITRVLGRISRTSSDFPDESRAFQFEIPRLKPFAQNDP
jgi:hypothetical protein